MKAPKSTPPQYERAYRAIVDYADPEVRDLYIAAPALAEALNCCLASWEAEHGYKSHKPLWVVQAEEVLIAAGYIEEGE